MKKFLEDSLEFHPCTHAEIAVILDAAKLGVSIRNATLYTTTFPCHLCAKDIVNSGIKRVVYLEAYPKSKNKKLYPNIIDFDPKHKGSLLPFDFFHGVSPKRYGYVYSEKNTVDNQVKNKNAKKVTFLKHENSTLYEKRENDIIDRLKCYLSDNMSKTLDHLRYLDELLNIKP